MKTLLISVVVACTASLSFTANAGMKFVGETEYAPLCEAAATNNAGQLKKSVIQTAREFGYSERKMLNVLNQENNFQCSGQNLVEFAEVRGSTAAVNYLTGNQASATPVIQQASSKYKFVGDNDYASFCKSALNNDLGQFKRAVNNKVGTLASSRKKVLSIALEGNNISCDGVSLVEFFEKNNATDVLDFIAQ
ncbi:DUF3718 domain-containing protein [Paraglaciecola aquimarina]|uniref:DUF3718 domain-containing protein n=1 Tax=Paraglaciecola algarum TaxID=3050085 RepID=A0ABS9D591_9ALTE|nr:DUF3718 domain-containing protein [Paraglaciecola sp. G1-23]MCF2948080.1 DUF3718 domain-containing protein [Paraglaciecola sp. G1-23]